ncbi:MAG: alpha-mannosidase, partial [Planctomycetes bacterium]|nr:alpha-mannosidase [Planctomycetota bacterium]
TELTRGISASGLERPIVVFNSLSWARTGPVVIDAPRGRRPWTVTTADGKPLATQAVREGRRSRLLFQAPDVPSMGYVTFDVRGTTSRAAVASDLQVGKRKLENERLRVSLNAAGQITSIHDKRAGREVLAEGGMGNQLQLFEDKPVTTDAWDIDIYYLDKAPVVLKASSVTVTAQGPVKASLEMTYETRAGSRIVQEVALYAGEPMLVFNTQVDWHETDKMLKAAFPVAVHSRRATYEIQFGHIDRPTHWSTSWDKAKFEVPAHRWADLSEAGYGVALLNDCKYGYDIKDNVMRLTLLRAPTTPDPEADRGEHEFEYALYPHQGDLQAAEVVRRGYEFNVPLLMASVPGDGPGDLPASHSFFSLDSDRVVLDTVKPAEDGKGLVTRLYEAHGGRGVVTLNFGFDVTEGCECDCLERPIGPVAVKGNALTFSVTPFEIKTFRVVPA